MWVRCFLCAGDEMEELSPNQDVLAQNVMGIEDESPAEMRIICINFEEENLTLMSRKALQAKSLFASSFPEPLVAESPPELLKMEQLIQHITDGNKGKLPDETVKSEYNVAIMRFRNNSWRRHEDTVGVDDRQIMQLLELTSGDQSFKGMIRLCVLLSKSSTTAVANFVVADMCDMRPTRKDTVLLTALDFSEYRITGDAQREDFALMFESQTDFCAFQKSWNELQPAATHAMSNCTILRQLL